MSSLHYYLSPEGILVFWARSKKRGIPFIFGPMMNIYVLKRSYRDGLHLYGILLLLSCLLHVVVVPLLMVRRKGGF
jgi:hypothetical protein